MTALTREMIHARLPQQVHPSIEAESLSEFELRATMLQAIAERPATSGVKDGIWLFAYGALLWERKFSWDAEKPCTVRGLVRRYCLSDTCNRGTPERPGMTLGLLRQSGECGAAAVHLPERNLEEALWAIWKQEMAPGHYDAEWVNAGCDGEAMPVLAFVAQPQRRSFIGELTLDRTAELLATCVGKGGTAAEYLLNTAHALRDRGCPDPYLDELVEGVAQRLAGAGQRAVP